MDKSGQRKTQSRWAVLSSWTSVPLLSRTSSYVQNDSVSAVGAIVGRMERPGRFEHSRFLGDKRTQLVYDLDEWTDVDIIADIVGAGVGLCFGPDTLAEARNRGYKQATLGKTRRHRQPRA